MEDVLPWPECLGTFDEESCRFFLRELGQKVVQFYPFSVGMDEVFSQIVDRYGYEGAADAISVLQELLEDESTAAGAGDDGDIWRSWRHSWRHRNVGFELSIWPVSLTVLGQCLQSLRTTRQWEITAFTDLNTHSSSQNRKLCNLPIAEHERARTNKSIIVHDR